MDKHEEFKPKQPHMLYPTKVDNTFSASRANQTKINDIKSMIKKINNPDKSTDGKNTFHEKDLHTEFKKVYFN